MQNCNGRAAFNMNYAHDELRTPAMLLADRVAGLSINAPEFVPKRPGPPGPMAGGSIAVHHPQHHPQQPPPHFAVQSATAILAYQQQLQPAHLGHPAAGAFFQHHNAPHMQPNPHAQRRGGNGRHNLQDRLNPFADYSQQQPTAFHVQPHRVQHNNHHNSSHHQSHHQHYTHHQVAAAQQVPVHLLHQAPNLHQHHQSQHGQAMHHQQSHHQRGGRGNARNNGSHHPIDNSHAAYAGEQPDENPSEAELGALNHLTKVMAKLTDDPGLFESCQKELNAVYIDFAQNCFVISNSIEILFEQSINEPNFRYMGARVCRLLDGIVATPDSIVREMLSAKMGDTQMQNKAFIVNESHKVRGCALFLAELFLQLQNDGNRIPAIGENIYKTLDELLQKLTPENIKCVCQTLKLCGYELELDFPGEVSNIIAILRQQKDVDVSTERLINSVLDLQSNRWGRNEASSLAASSVPTDNNSQAVFTNDPVFYGPDGKIITEEESSFLSGIVTAATEDSMEEEDDLDPGMDSEMKRAYKDFVKNYSTK